MEFLREVLGCEQRLKAVSDFGMEGGWNVRGEAMEIKDRKTGDESGNENMSSTDLFKEARHLSVVERLELIDQLIDSVETDSPQALCPELESELDRRYTAFLAKPDEGEAWEVVREKIQRNLDAAQAHRQA